jgi:hypothetical protein
MKITKPEVARTKLRLLLWTCLYISYMISQENKQDYFNSLNNVGKSRSLCFKQSIRVKRKRGKNYLLFTNSCHKSENTVQFE